jgi:hypothetical protein
MQYAIDANRRYYRVASRRYNSTRTLGQRAPAVVLGSAFVLYAALVMAAVAGWLDWTGHAPPRSLAMLLMSFSLMPALIRLYSTSRKRHFHMTVIPGSSGMEAHSGSAVSLTDWSQFTRAVRFLDGILLLQASHYHWLPDGALHGSTPLEVVDLVRSKMPVEMRA